jgi:hypothetical protein
VLCLPYGLWLGVLILAQEQSQPVPKKFKKVDFFDFFYMYVIQHCFICRPSDSTVSEDYGIEPRTVATLALTARRSKPSASLKKN